MKAKCYFDSSGKLINIGEWDFKVTPARFIQPIVDPATGIILREGAQLPEITENPLPDGVYFEMREVVETPAGKFLAEDYASLRRSEYPPIADQLDALWKGGAELENMRTKIVEVKAKFPKN